MPEKGKDSASRLFDYGFGGHGAGETRDAPTDLTAAEDKNRQPHGASTERFDAALRCTRCGLFLLPQDAQGHTSKCPAPIARRLRLDLPQSVCYDPDVPDFPWCVMAGGGVCDRYATEAEAEVRVREGA